MNTFRSERYWMRGQGMVNDRYSVRGEGIGSIFSTLFSKVTPIIGRLAKKAINVGQSAIASNTGRQVKKELKRSLSKAGLNIVGDALQGKNIVESGKKQLKTIANNTIKSALKSSNKSKRSKPPKNKTQRKPKQNNTDWNKLMLASKKNKQKAVSFKTNKKRKLRRAPDLFDV